MEHLSGALYSASDSTGERICYFVPKDLPLLLSWVHQYDLSQTPERLQERPMLFWHGTEDEKFL